MCSQLAPVSLCSWRSLGFQPGLAQQKEPQLTNSTGCKAERGHRKSSFAENSLSPDEKWIYSKKKKAGETENPRHEAKICGQWATLVWGVGPGPSPLPGILITCCETVGTLRGAQPQSSQLPASSLQRLLSGVLAPCFEGWLCRGDWPSFGEERLRKPMGGENETGESQELHVPASPRGAF